MLIRNRKPPETWRRRLTKVFGTADWEEEFYSTTQSRSLFAPTGFVEFTGKTADHRKISDFFVKRLGSEFKAVADPLPLYNSTGSLLFLLYFAATNNRGAELGIRIAQDIIGK
jgi:hypothetical protein